MKLDLQEKPGENSQEKNKKGSKRIRVNYPLFVKKSRDNMFQRAIREDFKKKEAKKEILKESEMNLRGDFDDSIICFDPEDLKLSPRHRKKSNSLIQIDILPNKGDNANTSRTRIF